MVHNRAAPRTDNDALIDLLRKALNHLYDPDYLATSPLCAALGVTSRYDRAPKLQRILEEAIAALKPKPNESPDSKTWRFWRILTYRYLQCLTLQEVANQLNVSISQLVREQKAALCVLAAYLSSKYELTGVEKQAHSEEAGHPGADQPQFTQDGEDLGWLSAAADGDLPTPREIVQEAAALASPLLAQYRARLVSQVPDDLPSVVANRIALRQIVLTLLNAIAHFAEGGTITFETHAQADEVTLHITGARPSGTPTQDRWTESLEMARRLSELSGGRLEARTDQRMLVAALSYPAVQSVPVLLVDDSADQARLFQRFTAQSRYRLIHVRNAHQAVELAQSAQARVVVLDIMMPSVDGWAVLQELRSNPTTARIPVVVCSVLPLEEMCLSLGADAFLHKPVSQELFLSTLGRLAHPEQARPQSSAST
jgi:CheY-like chemotaxis protein